LNWSSVARQSGPFSGYQRVQAAYYQAVGLAMLGKFSEALQLFDSPEAGLAARSPAWLVQAWGLHRADILYLCGCHTAAMAQGREAIGRPPALHATSFAGAFARWLALVSVHDERSSGSCRVLDDLLSGIDELDMLDRVELICGRLILGDRSRSQLEELLRKYLISLPSAVSSQLQRLGVLRI
jgi:hypothetical protein